MERTIQLVQPMKLAERKLLRVAAYARVSCDKDAMKHSLTAQISYYNEYIQRRSDWAFAGIYADEAYSGTKDDRPRFVQMIKACKDGKIDRIITKSINCQGASPQGHRDLFRGQGHRYADRSRRTDDYASCFSGTRRKPRHQRKLQMADQEDV